MAVGPGGVEAVPYVGGVGAEGDAAAVAGLGGGELAGGDGSFDARGSSAGPGEVGETKRGELPAPSTGVGGETDQEQVLLGAVDPIERRSTFPRRGIGWFVVVDVSLEQAELGGEEQGVELVLGQGPAWIATAGTAHQPERVVVDEAFVVGPRQAGPQGPEPAAAHRQAGAGVLPVAQAVADLLRGQQLGAQCRDRIGAQRAGV